MRVSDLRPLRRYQRTSSICTNIFLQIEWSIHEETQRIIRTDRSRMRKPFAIHNVPNTTILILHSKTFLSLSSQNFKITSTNCKRCQQETPNYLANSIPIESFENKKQLHQMVITNPHFYSNAPQLPKSSMRNKLLVKTNHFLVVQVVVRDLLIRNLELKKHIIANTQPSQECKFRRSFSGNLL